MNRTEFERFCADLPRASGAFSGHWIGALALAGAWHAGVVALLVCGTSGSAASAPAIAYEVRWSAPVVPPVLDASPILPEPPPVVASADIVVPEIQGAVPPSVSVASSAPPDALRPLTAPPAEISAPGLVSTNGTIVHAASEDDIAYWARVGAAIVRELRYPDSARRRGMEGLVVIDLTLGDAGEVLRATPRAGEAGALLESAALEAICRAAPFSAPPPDGSRCAAVPVRFRLKVE